MIRSKRYKFVKLSIYFLVYSIIHIISVKSDEKSEILHKSLSHLPSLPPPKDGDEVKVTEILTEKNKNGEVVDTTEIKTEYVDPKTKAKTEIDVKTTEVEKAQKTPVKEPKKTEVSTKPTSPSHKPTELGTTTQESTDNSTKSTPASKEKEKHEKQHEKHTKGTKGEHSKHNKNTHTKETPNTDTVKKEHNKISEAVVHSDTHETEITNITVYPTNETDWFKECTPPAIKQFPKPLMPPEVRKHGGLIIHTVVAIYMFIGLAIVCDEYFVASLDRICEELKMSPDVAGATFMAAGSSAPELATVIIGVFCADDDIGISGVIGSAVFNIMFVVSVCALASSTAVYLNWWPLIRDSTFYAISILVMLVVIGDKEIHLWESIFMLSVYVVYGVALHFNSFLEALAHQIIPFHVPHPPNEQSGLVCYNALEDDGGKKPNYGMDNEYGSGYQQQQSTEKMPEWNPSSDWSPDRTQSQIGFPNQQQQSVQPLSGPALNQATTTNVSQPFAAAPIGPVQSDYYRPKEYDASTKVNHLVRPEGASNWSWAWIKWVVLYPIHFFAIHSMPDCRSEKYKNWYPFTFFMSMMWISFYSYFMVWMITIIGFTLSIPDTVMGLTFVAAGVSVPDALSSIAVIKEGYGDMAVSNAVGSNVFDILVCLGLPWFLKTAFGSPVKVVSKGLWYSTFSLLSTVVFLVMAIHFNGWKLDKKFGIVLMVWYLIFLTFASLYELNVFGNWNPPECKVPNW